MLVLNFLFMVIVVLLLLLLFDRIRRRGGCIRRHVLDIGNYYGGLVRVDVVLLNSVVAAQGEQNSTGAKVGDGGDAFYGRNNVVRDLFSSHVPGVGGAVRKNKHQHQAS